MKQMIIACSLMLSTVLANAQNPAPGEHWGSNDNAPSGMTKAVNEFDKTTMNVKDGTMTFIGLPEVKSSAYVVVTNAAGEVIKQAKINPAKNMMKLGSLPSDLYFVTIIHDNKNKKAFTLKV